MTEVLPDPYQEFLAQDPSILTEPEMAQYEEIQRGKMPIALGLAAAFLLYRSHMARRLKQEVRKMGAEATRHTLLVAASATYNAFVPRWVSMTVPYLVAGYIEGVRSAESGHVPVGYLERIAEGYAEELGRHLNDVSQEAMVSGFQTQLNRRVPAQMAARRVVDAYGVPQRGMNALVNVWSTEEKPRFTDQPLPSVKAERAQAMIEAQNELRARQVGENEHWAARTQAKQIVWLYGQSHGLIPGTARRVWITANDERVCSICGPLDGVSAPVGRKFMTDSGKFWTPPSHINCRCDVVLDLEEDIESALTSFLEDQSVAKAVGGDPFDRDKRGRFARDESRQVRYKEREAEVDAMVAQVNQALTQPVQLKPLSVKPEKTKLLLQPLKGPTLLKPLSVSQPESKTKMKLKLKIQAKSKLTLSPDLFKPEKIRAEDIETEEGNWEYMDQVLTTVMDPYQQHDIGDTIMHSDETPFYEEYISGEVFDPKQGHTPAKPRTLGEAIGDYWMNWAETEMEEFRINQGGTQVRSNLYHDESTDTTWRVTEEAYEAVLADLINGTPKMYQDIVELEGLNENEGEVLTATTGEVAAQFGVRSKMENEAPILMQTKHGMRGVTEKLSGHEWRNPGRWRVVNIREVWDPHETNYHHLGYTILEVEPADLFSDE